MTASLRALALVVLCCALSACQAASDSAQPLVTVGVLLPLTGDFRTFGELSRNAIATTPLTSNLSFTFEDTACDARKALETYRKLSSVNGVRVFLGPCCGNELETIAPVLATHDQLVLGLCSSTRSLYNRSQGKILSTAFSIEFESEFMARAIEARGARNIAVVYYRNTFSEAHERAFRRALKVARASSFAFDSVDPEAIRSIIVQLRSQSPDAIYVPDLTPFLLSFSKQLKHTGVADIPLYSIHALQTPDLFAAEGPAADGIIYSHPDIGDEPADAYFSRTAATFIDDAVRQCMNNVACIKSYLLSTQSFSAHGTIDRSIVLRTVKQGRFEALPGNALAEQTHGMVRGHAASVVRADER